MNFIEPEAMQSLGARKFLQWRVLVPITLLTYFFEFFDQRIPTNRNTEFLASDSKQSITV